MKETDKQLNEYHPDNLVRGRVYDLTYSGVTKGDNTYLIRGTFINLAVMKDNRRAKGAGKRVSRLTVIFKNEQEEFSRCFSWWRIISFTRVG